MNFNGVSLPPQVKSRLEGFDFYKRAPHAIIVESADSEARARLCDFLAEWAVCSENERPCGECKNCLNAKKRSHSDISYVKGGSNKSGTVSVETVREVTQDCVIIPNEADCKVYVFENADKTLTPISQNALLKTLEEPPKNVMFILSCADSRILLDTVRSRCELIAFGGEITADSEAMRLAERIAAAICSPSEYELLLSCSLAENNKTALETLDGLTLIFRDALAASSGAKTVLSGSKVPFELSGRITRARLLELLQCIEKLKILLKQNVNFNLFATYMCAQLRRIVWQK